MQLLMHSSSTQCTASIFTVFNKIADLQDKSFFYMIKNIVPALKVQLKLTY